MTQSKTKTQRLVALQTVRRSGDPRFVARGAEFDARPQEARDLIALGRAKPVPAAAPGKAKAATVDKA